MVFCETEMVQTKVKDRRRPEGSIDFMSVVFLNELTLKIRGNYQ